MTYYTIPTSTQNPHYQQSVTLSGVNYVLTLRYNTRMQRWVLDVADASANTIVAGIVLLTQRNLVGQYTTLALPPGVLFCLNLGNDDAQPSLTSFLTDTQFIYAEPTT